MKISIVVDTQLIDGQAAIRRSTFDKIQKDVDALLRIPEGVSSTYMGDDPFRPQFVMTLSHNQGLAENTLYVSQDVKNRIYKDKTELIIQGA